MTDIDKDPFADDDDELLDENEDEMQDDEAEKVEGEVVEEDVDAEFKVKREFETVEANENGTTVAEILGLSKLSKYNRMTHNSIERYDIDIEIYQDIVDQSPVIQQTLEDGEKVLKTFKYLQQDLFLSLYKYNAIMVDENKVYPSTRMNRKILAEIFDTDEFITLRKSCRLDVFNAALGAEVLGRKALEMLQKTLDDIANQEGQDQLQQQMEEIDQLLEQEENLDQLLDENDELDQMIEEMRQQEAQGMPGASQQIAEMQAQQNANEMSLQQGKAMANRIAQQCDQLINVNDSIVEQNAQTMTKAMPDLTKDINEVSGFSNAWGLGSGSTARVPFNTKKEAIQKLRGNNKLLKITDLLGKMKDTAIDEQKKKSKHGAVEIKSVTVGDKIENTLPSERMNMVNDVTRKDFMRRMTEHSLLTYQKESTKNKNKGPIIVCVDTSGSMDYGNREIWSKALAVSVLEIAQMQKRDYACIIYSSHADKPIIIKKGEISPDKVIDVATRFHDGGTDFESPLNEALKLIQDSTFKEADILFISDGDCYLSDSYVKKFKQIKEEKEFKCNGILINSGGRTSDTSLKEFCDNVTFITNITDMTQADSDVNKQIFGSL